MDDICTQKCSECELQCITKSAKYIVVGGKKITLAESDKKP